MQFHSPSPEITQRAASLLAMAAPSAGLVVVLSGPLGAGKTVFAKGLGMGFGFPVDRVTSPTFTICSEYTVVPDRLAGRGPDRFVHADGYRLADARELEDAGLLDWLEPGTLVAIEWGERFREALPADRLEIVLSRPPDEAAATAQDGGCETARRRIDAVASGVVSAAALSAWQHQLRGDPELFGLESSKSARV